MKKIKIALLQLHAPNSVEEALEKGLVACKEAKKNNADIALFPELWSNGYYVFSKYADLHYKVTEFYNPHSEGGLNWRDPNIGIKWPIKNPIINNRDKNFPFLSQLTADQLPKL